MKTTPLKIYTRGKQIWLYRRVDGKKCEYASGFAVTSQNQAYLKKNGEVIFWEKYNEKHGLKAPEVIKIDFRSYGKLVLESTAGDRNTKSQKSALMQYESLCETFGDFEIEQIKALNITAWQTTMANNGYSAKTIQNYRGVLSLILHYAHGDGLITVNPLVFVKLPKKEKKEVFAFGLKDMQKIINAADGQFKNLLQFAFFTGMRPSEIIALRWSKINWKELKIKVDVCRVDGVEDLPKGKKIRTVDMLPQAREALERQHFLTAGVNDHVFITQYKEPYQASKVLDDRFKELLSEINMPVVRFYTTKKSFITLMKNLNMNESWIIQQVGHEDKLVSREHYTAALDTNYYKLEDIAI